ncbi:hypothetical protein EMIT0P176_220031 [Pseudomonas sp. IT-P176]
MGAGARLRLARDGGVSGTIDVEWAGPIASKPQAGTRSHKFLH